MHSKQAFMLAALVFMEFSALGQSRSTDMPAHFTLQVAAFADESSARAFAEEMASAGERPHLVTADIEGRGQWVRVLIGAFDSYAAARAYGERLLANRLVRTYLIRGSRSATRPRRVAGNDTGAMLAKEKRKPSNDAAPQNLAQNIQHRVSASAGQHPGLVRPFDGWFALASPALDPPDETAPSLPRGGKPLMHLTPEIDLADVPRPEPVRKALRMLAASPHVHTPRAGGLWLSGDTQQAFEYLRWILGDRYGDLLTLGEDGRVGLRVEELSRRMAIRGHAPGAELIAAEQIARDEGLLLLVQLIEGPYRYLLHIGNPSPTLGGDVRVPGSINLDHNFDSRINLYRRNRRKLNTELPPRGFDAMVGLNPVARWFNLSAGRIVPVGVIVFHELAEAHAKVALHLQYLDDGTRIGAHNLALEREQRLKSQRPLTDIVLTTGSNRVLRSEEEIRQFYAEGAGALGSQR